MPADAPIYPPLALSTQRSILEVLDFHLEHNPGFPIYTFANDESDQATIISMLEYVRVAHRAGAAIRNTGSARPGEIIAIIAALVDTIVFSAIITGMMKVGFTPFPISFLISPDAVAKSFKRTIIVE
ncbi:hypothetical protein D9758_010237 [Tetrapyrgos nigripes]|uniref:Uncharacterized protein n=1 Tax=Tetrapyrgos nigripes TaxID=182062 RepID=A0A8H5CXP3_9AGAR|nr:hypothetical protein D9758_010237 [Tetrapyrgos nigripes]